MCEAFDGSAVSTLRATSADSAFSQAAKKHKGKKGTFPRSTKKQRKQVQKNKGDQSITFPKQRKKHKGKKGTFPSSTKNIGNKKKHFPSSKKK